MLKSFLSLSLMLVSLNVLALGGNVGEPGANYDPNAVSHYITRPDGIKVHYTVMGKGTPILLIHGYYATGDANWYTNGIAQELAKTHKVISMDQRGHGKTDRPRRRKYYGANMWKDALAILDNEKVDKVHLHGYSMGGVIVTQLLYYHPERVISAIYGGSGVFEYDKEEQKKIPEDLEPTEEIKKQEEEAENLVIETTKPDHVALFMIRRNPPNRGEDKKIDLTKVDIPVLAITGEYDSPNARTYRMTRDLKNFRNIILPGKGHLTAIVPGYMPKEYLEETLRFTREIDSK